MKMKTKVNQKQKIIDYNHRFNRVFYYVTQQFKKRKDYENNKDFYEDKIQTANYYFNRVLPRVESHFKTAMTGSNYIMDFKFNQHD